MALDFIAGCIGGNNHLFNILLHTPALEKEHCVDNRLRLKSFVFAAFTHAKHNAKHSFTDVISFFSSN